MSDFSENSIKRHDGDLRESLQNSFPFVFRLAGVEVHVGAPTETEVGLAIRPPDYHGFPWLVYRVDRRDLVDLAERILKELK